MQRQKARDHIQRRLDDPKEIQRDRKTERLRDRETERQRD